MSMSWALILALLCASTISSTDAWSTLKGRRHQWHLRSHSDRYPGGEVIGSAGKIGSYIFHRLNTPIEPLPLTDEASTPQYPQSLHAASVPRGVAPGCLSPNDTPIYACIPSSSIVDVWDSTLPHRRKDLVFLCNCIPSRHLTFDSDVDVTIAILHFGVSHGSTNYDVKASSLPIPKLNNSPQSPPTVIYGKHATTLGSLLQKDGITVQIASEPNEVQVAAARKIAWSSLMWLTCHGTNDGGEPVKVKDVHEHKSKELQRLVEEILPALELLASESWMENSQKETVTSPSSTSVGSVQEILDYLESYSMSISNGNVVPSRELALREIGERNGLLLSLTKTILPSENGGGEDRTASSHLDLIQRLAGKEALAQCLEPSTGVEEDQDATDSNRDKRVQRVQCTSSDLEFLFHSRNSVLRDSSTPKSVIVIGAGMLGSSIAYHLSKRGVNVTVMDQRTNLLPANDGEDGKNHDIDPGTATSSSFAWLNANDKSPLSYKQLNQLGMEFWRRHDVLQHLPVWCGTLVRSVREKENDARNERSLLRKSPYYVRVGPLDQASSQELEPGVDWPSSVSEDSEDASANESEINFYPEEGHVDPAEAVKVLRSSASDNGVDFLEEVQINNLVRDENDKVIGVEYTQSLNDANAQSVLTKADVVIIAAGANSANPILGIGSKRLQLLEQPGVLAYARRKKNSSDTGNDSTDDCKALKRIFVDTIAQTHTLRRPDKTIVVGGGELVVGGEDDKSLHTGKTIEGITTASTLSQRDDLIGNAMINTVASAIDPFELKSIPQSSGSTSRGYELVQVSRANRPMPSDGLPVVGFVDQGLYVAVMHSGITLGLLAGELASYEVWNEVASGNNDERCGMDHNGFQFLDNYRPSRCSIQEK